jgi:soluble lytic murein transglycosylase-like protein
MDRRALTLLATAALAAAACAGERGAAPGAPDLPAVQALHPESPAAATLADHLCQRAPALAACAEVAAAIEEEAARAGLDPALVLGVIEVESRWRTGAVSSRQARGLMQLRRRTFEREVRAGRLGRADAHDPLVNVRAGVRYLARLSRAFDDPDLVLVAYNAGPTRLRRLLRLGAVPERLLGYPRRVRREERIWRERLGEEAAGALLAAAAVPAPRAE